MYKNRTPIILALDFDETISITDWPTIVGLRKGAKKYINKLFDRGYYIIVWTCRHGRNEDEAYNFLKSQGIKFHAINEQHPALIKAFNNNTRKISADIYVDDKSLWLFGIPNWFWLYWLIRLRSLDLIPSLSRFCNKEDY